MGNEMTEYVFPDPDGDDEVSVGEIEIEDSTAVEVGKELPSDDKVVPETAEPEAEIEIIDDTPEEDRGKTKGLKPHEEVTDDELAGYSDKVKKRINGLTRSFHDERRERERVAREQAELVEFSKRLIDENKQLKNTAGKNAATLYEQAKRQISGEIETAQKEYRLAHDAGNAEETLAAQEKLTSARIREDRLSRIKAPTPPAESPVEPVAAQPEPRQPQPEIRAAADPKRDAWFAENQWFGTTDDRGDEMTKFALLYHNTLDRQGVDLTSDEYYEKINKRMREVYPDEFGSTEPEPKNDAPANVVAAATRTTAPKTVRLTKSQQSIAKVLGLTLPQYAKQLAAEERKENV